MLIPLKDNKGVEFPEIKFVKLRKNFLDEFGGYTRILPPSHGEWKKSSKSRSVEDYHVGYEVIMKQNFFTNKIKFSLDTMIKNLEEEFKQEKISCYYHNVKSNL